MMNLKEIADIINEKKYFFQIILPNKRFLHGRTSILQALADKPSIEEYIQGIIKENKATNVLIKLFSANGSSFKNRGEYFIFFDDAKAVATITNIETKIATTDQLKGLEPAKINNTMSDKDYIDFKVLQSEHNRIKDSNEEKKERIKKLELKIEELHEENKKVLRENITKDDKHALAIEREKLNLEKEAKGGLSGLVGELSEKPELLKMIAGFIKPDHPMFKDDSVGKIEVEEVRYHDDEDANNILKEVPKLFKLIDPALVIRFYTISTQFAKQPTKIEEAFNNFFPNHQ